MSKKMAKSGTTPKDNKSQNQMGNDFNSIEKKMTVVTRRT